jgi:chemotaxis signal transduction protein
VSDVARAETDRTGARALAEAFDRTFAEPARPAAEELETLLGLVVGRDGYAVRLVEIQGLVREPKIVAVPSDVPELLGLTGLRGRVVPVYSLRGLLGGAPTAGPVPWIVLVGGDAPVGLAFEHYDGYLRIAPSDRAVVDGAVGESGSAVSETIRIGGALRGVIDVRLVLRALAARIGVTSPAKKKES